ncbi:zona pellucida-like domain-containing protein 1 [Rhinatrema bivittatum]|uniref:zona pellucida-like domain-containing protein 1 n=1 Tax=Rhinatrema bivittatum TaxID=194408 RepID=UPI00112A1217|nr:zona pellucida-like domain-containing protein 1 [Rhinatrema bivittatum]
MLAVCVLLLAALTQQCTGDAYNCSSAYSRYPANSDIAVTCGPTSMFLSINLCPVVYANFDPLLLALNGIHNQTNCGGTLDNSTDPPVMTFTLPLNNTACGNSVIQQNIGSGVFSDYSVVQTVVISGFVDTPALSEGGLISYSTNLYYNFSCRYPLQYLLNNTLIQTSSAALAVNTNNGSFLSTLRMSLFSDSAFSSEMPTNGTILPLKTTVYVQVNVTNLTNFNVLLAECFATPSPVITTIPAERYSFLTGCNVNNKTTVIANGNGTTARFSFETFRFLQHSGQKTSSIYLHCITRLCQPDVCTQTLNSCNNNSTRRRREANAAKPITSPGSSNSVTVSSGPIYTGDEAAATEEKQLQSTLTGLIVGLVITAILGTCLIVISAFLIKKYRLRGSQSYKSG